VDITVRIEQYRFGDYNANANANANASARVVQTLDGVHHDFQLNCSGIDLSSHCFSFFLIQLNYFPLFPDQVTAAGVHTQW
jgi:hypothetical protein